MAGVVALGAGFFGVGAGGFDFGAVLSGAGAGAFFGHEVPSVEVGASIAAIDFCEEVGFAPTSVVVVNLVKVTNCDGERNNDMVGKTRKRSYALARQIEQIEPSILTVRGHKVLLDADLAEIYYVKVKALNQAVKRNSARFPSDFMFQLSWEEARTVNGLRSQNVTLKRGAHLKYRPYAFTEHGAVMLASILKSSVAVTASIAVVRAFVRLRQMVLSHEEFRARLEVIEKKLEDHDEKFGAVFEAIRALMDEEPQEQVERPRIGYQTEGLKRGKLMYTTLGPKET